MTGNRLALLLAIAAIAVWWIGRARSPAEPVVPADPVPETPALTHAPTAVPTVAPTVAKAVRPPKLAPQAVRAEANPDGNTIRFQVDDGLAIAYGDLILGQPEDPTLRDGYFEAPPPSLWERPELPYAIRPDLPKPERVRKAIEHIQSLTPVRFVPYDGTQPDAIVFETGKQHCYSLLGRQGGLQPIKLGAECGWREITHEILHALGFVHEQSRTDRDRHLEILWPNIEEDKKPQFDKVPDAFMEASRQGPFDYQSVMLYPTDMFAAHPGSPTMRSVGNQRIDPSENGLSRGDIERLLQLYRPYAK